MEPSVGRVWFIANRNRKPPVLFQDLSEPYLNDNKRTACYRFWFVGVDAGGRLLAVFPQKLSADQIYELPNYEYVSKGLKKVSVTFKILWAEYKNKCLAKGNITIEKPNFCAETAITSHFEHKPGQRSEVDWNGPTLKSARADDGEIKVYNFVSCFPYN